MTKAFSVLIFSLFIINSTDLIAQDFASSKAEYDSMYVINITKTKVNGIYIPKDLEDAHRRILKLTPANAISKFKSGPEVEVCQKLEMGIGRWMILNWNFYDGSRLSHFLKGMGLLHPDDMSNFILRTLHRHLNMQEANHDEIIKSLADNRKKIAIAKSKR